jgi:hypothetical protein
MSERHPIDELFHRALHDAEVTPPPAVWEGIVRKRTERRGGFRGWLLAVLLVGSGLAAWWAFGTRTEQALHVAEREVTTPVDAQPANRAEPVGEASTAPATAPVTSSGAATTTTEVSTPDPSPIGAGSSTASDDLGGAASASNANSTVHTGTGSSTNTGRMGVRANTSTSGSGGASAPGGSAAMHVVRDAEPDPLDRLSVVVPALLPAPIIRDSVRRAEDPQPYVLPNADWWVALELGRYDERRTWYGDDGALVNALNATEVPHYTTSIGVLGGRSWRNGFGLSLGVAYEGSSQSFQFNGASTQQDTVLYFPYLVTLDTQVFVSNVDTVPTYVTVQERTNATNSFSVVRVSAEGHWHANLRRWTIGPRLGLGTEFTTMRKGYTLDSGSDTLLTVVNAAEESYDARYATVLTALIGADVGFALTEHWGLWATPTYARGLVSWGPSDAPYMLPERIGLRLRLSYTFTRSK